jgi:hypothetical protein
MILNLQQARELNNQLPGNQNIKIGDAIRVAQDGRQITQQQYVRYVDPNVEVSGLGATLIVAPGFYIESAAGVPVLTASDCTIIASGLPEQTMWFGSGTNGVVDAATDDLLKILGGNNSIIGLGLYVHKDDKAAILFDDTGGGYAGSFNLVKGCYFSPQAQDGVGYGIKYSGGNVNIIEGNIFYGAKTAAILLTGAVGNPVRNIIRNNHFVGTAIGIQITSANYNTLIQDNWFSAGSQSGEGMTNGIVISSGMNAGKVTVARNFFEQSAANDISDSKAGGSLIEMDNSNGA